MKFLILGIGCTPLNPPRTMLCTIGRGGITWREPHCSEAKTPHHETLHGSWYHSRAVTGPVKRRPSPRQPWTPTTHDGSCWAFREKVYSMKWMMQFNEKRKLSPRYVWPYKILECIGKAAYKLKLPLEMIMTHLVFYVFMFRKFIGD